jgi:hypothetical protein
VTSTASPPLSTGFLVSVFENGQLFLQQKLTRFQGDDVIVHPSVKGEEAEKLFPKMNIVKPYLRFTPLPKEETSASA